jgi:hypothetical protein
LDEDDPFLNALPGKDAAKFSPNIYDELEDKRDAAYKKELEAELQYSAKNDEQALKDSESSTETAIDEPVTVPIPMGQDENGVSPDMEPQEIEDRPAPMPDNEPEMVEPGPELDAAPGEFAE